MKLSTLQQKTKLAAASAEEARARSAAASKTLEQIRERLHQAKLDLKKAKKRAKQAKREARRAVGDAASLAKSLAKAEKKTRKRRKSGEAREAAAGSGEFPGLRRRGTQLRATLALLLRPPARAAPSRRPRLRRIHPQIAPN